MHHIKDDGGPAFSRPCSLDGPTDNCNYAYEQEGMSLRDYFAGQILAGASGDVISNNEEFAAAIWNMADAMIKARSQ